MGILRKLIGLFFLVIIFFIILKSKVILPRISNWVIGPEKTPFQIGASYTEQVYKLSPSYAGSGNDYQVKYGTLNQGYPRTMRGVTVSKTINRITLTTEGVAVPVNVPWVLWLSNTPTITDATKYLNFGKIIEPYTFHEYYTDIGKAKIDLIEYKYLMVVNPQTYQLYSLWTLK